MAGRPLPGQGGQQVQCPGVALQQHFGNDRRGAESAVQLVGGAEKIGQKPVFQVVLVVFVGFLPFTEPKPHQADPYALPAAETLPVQITAVTLVAVLSLFDGGIRVARQAAFERFAGGGKQFGCVHGDLVGGKQAVQMRDVPVTDFGFRVILDPLLNATRRRADQHRGNPGHGRFQFGFEFRLEGFSRRIQIGNGAEAVGKQFAANLHIHRGSVRELVLRAIGFPEGVFRRVRRVSDQLSGHRQPRRNGLEEIQIKLGGSFHERKRLFPEKFPVARKLVMLIRMVRQPAAAHGPNAHHAIHGRSAPEHVGQVVHHPAPCPVHGAGGFLAVQRKRIHQGKQRLVAFGQVGGLGGHVIHLQVNVGVVVRTPRRPHSLVPDSLQVGGQISPARTGNQQIAAILEQQFRKVGILKLRGFYAVQPGILWQFQRVGLGVEIDFHPVIEQAVIGQVRLP